jgi:hypothetical protein
MTHFVLVSIWHKDGLFTLCSTEEIAYNVRAEACRAIEYEPKSVLDEEEWYKISNFSSQNFSIPLVKEKFNSTKYKEYTEKLHTNDIDYIVVVQNNEMYFQRVIKQNIINEKSWLHFGETVTFQSNNNSLILINSYPDAIYKITDDCLFFRKLSSLTRIFPGINMLFKEATEEVVGSFINSEVIQTEGEFCAANVGIANRKTIALIMEEWEKYNGKEKKRICKYIHSYCPGLNYSNGKFIIGSDKTLKQLLYGMDERYYTTPVGNEKRVAQAVLKLKVNS